MEDSFDLSEISNIANNDSGGHKLAEFLRKKSGKQIQRRIFDINTKRPSIEVRLRDVKSDQGEQQIENKKDAENNRTLPEETEKENSPVANVRNRNFISPIRVSCRNPIASYLKRTPEYADQLRQSTLKRLAQRFSEPRSLMGAFNNVSGSTGDEFSPPISSTPLCNGTPVKKITLQSGENHLKHKKDAAPNSPRRYTAEKGGSPGQILLTPLDLLPSGNNENGNENDHISRSVRAIGIVQDDPNVVNSLQAPILQTPKKVGNNNGLVVHVTHYSPRASNIEITCTDQQEILSAIPHDLAAQSKHAKKPRNKSIDMAEPTVNGGGTFTIENENHNSLKSATANIANVMTDDDDDDEPNSIHTEELKNKTNYQKSQRVLSNDSEPELSAQKKANSSPRIRNKLRKLRKRNTKSVIHAKTKEYVTPETRKSRISRLCLPLNKPPRTPINGEKFADELKKQLAGLSNLEVLDLRRRKSSSLSLRKSSTRLSEINPKNQTNHQNALNLRDKTSASNQPKESNEVGVEVFENNANDVDEQNRNEIDVIPSSVESENNQCQDIADEDNEIVANVNMNGGCNKEINERFTNENTLLPAQLENSDYQDEVFEDERSHDRVSFVQPLHRTSQINKKKNTSKQTRKKKGNKRSTPDICKSYINATQLMSSSKRRHNQSKRSLYSESVNEAEPLVPSNTLVEIVSPPLMFRSSTPRKRPQPQQSQSPSPEHHTHSNVQEHAEVQNDQINENFVFKKPQGFPLKRKKAQKKVSEEQTSSAAQECPAEEDVEPSLRRSKRSRKEVKPSFFWTLLEKHMIKSQERVIKKKSNNTTNTHSTIVPIASSSTNPMKNHNSKKSREKQKNQKQKSNDSERIWENVAELRTNINDIHNIENASKTFRKSSKKQKKSRLPSVPENEFETMASSQTLDFVQNQITKPHLPQSTSGGQRTNKSVRVRIKRIYALNESETPRSTQPEISSSVSPSQFTGNGQGESRNASRTPDIVSILKSLSTNESTTNNTCSLKSFTHMSLSSFNELNFKSHRDVDYAFYTTEMMGYMRFQPQQGKPMTRVKHSLRLIVLCGEICVNTSGEIETLRVGDLVTIKKGEFLKTLSW